MDYESHQDAGLTALMNLYVNWVLFNQSMIAAYTFGKMETTPPTLLYM
jgi:hypothetical protein